VQGGHGQSLGFRGWLAGGAHLVKPHRCAVCRVGFRVRAGGGCPPGEAAQVRGVQGSHGQLAGLGFRV